jgi:hypothetical protein
MKPSPGEPAWSPYRSNFAARSPANRPAEAVRVLLGRDRLVEVALVGVVVARGEGLVGEPQDDAGVVELAAEPEASSVSRDQRLK